MTVDELAQLLEAEILTGREEAGSRSVSGVYVCDLLSHAMAKIEAEDVWITVHTNLNVVAVALLSGAACVLIPEGGQVEEATLSRAAAQSVILLSGKASGARYCHEILRLLEGTE